MVEIILDASQLETFESCPKKWFYSYVNNLTVKSPNTALSTGSWLHEVLKFYYTIIATGAAPHNAIRPAIEYAASLTSGTEGKRWPRVAKDPKFHIDRLRAYLYHWLSDDENMKIVAVEKGFSQLLFESSDRRYILEGMIDLIIERPRSGLTVMDHKTQSRAYEKYYYNHQVLNYLLATGANYFEYNYIGWQDTVNTNTFDRPVFKAPSGVLEQWKLDVRLVFDDMFEIMTEVEKAGDYLGLGIRDMHKLFKRRRNSCQTKFGICEFHSICEVPDSSPWQPIVINSKYKEKDERWKPWS